MSELKTCPDCGDPMEEDEISAMGRCAICEWEAVTDLMTCNARMRMGECGEIACDPCPVAHLRG